MSRNFKDHSRWISRMKKARCQAKQSLCGLNTRSSVLIFITCDKIGTLVNRLTETYICTKTFRTRARECNDKDLFQSKTVSLKSPDQGSETVRESMIARVKVNIQLHQEWEHDGKSENESSRTLVVEAKGFKCTPIKAKGDSMVWAMTIGDNTSLGDED